MGSPTRISNYAAAGVAQLIGMYSKPRGAIVPLLPVILGITPNTGPSAGGTLVRITGLNFESVSSVTIGGAPCTGLIIGGGIITCYSPGGLFNAQAVSVTGPAGTTTLANAFTYPSAALQPTVTSVVTIGGGVGDIDGGYSATITGTNFIIGATTFNFGATAASGVTVTSTTSATCTVPSHASGAVAVSASTVGGNSSVNATFTYFSPTQLAFNLGVRGSFAGAPWAGVASTGTSVSNALTTVGVDPVAGPALNGKSPASYNGTSNYLMATNGGSNIHWSDIVSATAYYGACLLFVASAPAPTTNIYDNPCVAADQGGSIGLAVSSSGVAAFHYDGSGFKKSGWAPLPGGSYAFVEWWYDGTNINISVNGVLGTPGPAASVASLSALTVRVGSNYAPAAYLNGRIEDLWIAPTDLHANSSNMRSYADTRYGVTV